MANDTDGAFIYLDTFTSAISLDSIKLWSIEWVRPTTQGHLCTVFAGEGGPPLVEWQCVTAGKTFLKRFEGHFFPEVYIESSGVGSGAVIITLD